MRDFLKRLMCGHNWSPNLVSQVYYKGDVKKKRHYYYCKTCGKRKYVD